MRKIITFLRDEDHARAEGYALGRTAKDRFGMMGNVVCRYRDEPARWQIGMAGFEGTFRDAWWQGLVADDNPNKPPGEYRIKPKQWVLLL